MLTTDFSGTYDYEKTEAVHAAEILLEDLQEGYITSSELPARIEKTLSKWQSLLNSESFKEFESHFLATLNN